MTVDIRTTVDTATSGTGDKDALVCIADKGGAHPLELPKDEDMSRSISMLEMNEIASVREFEDAIETLTKLEADCSKMKEKEQADDFFFYDSDEDQEAKTEKKPVEKEPLSSASDGMRRSQSMVSMPATSMAAKRPLRIDPIVEEIIPEDNEANESAEKTLKAFDPHRAPKRSSMKKSTSAASFVSTSSSGSTGSSESTMKRNVSFSSLEIREYNITLGDNPAVSYGPPVSLDWSYRECGSMCVEQYETLRVPRRSREDLVLSYGARRFRLIKDAGFSMNDIKEAISDVKEIQKKRSKTTKSLSTAKFEEALESAGRKMKRLVKRKSLQ